MVSKRSASWRLHGRASLECFELSIGRLKGRRGSLWVMVMVMVMMTKRYYNEYRVKRMENKSYVLTGDGGDEHESWVAWPPGLRA